MALYSKSINYVGNNLEVKIKGLIPMLGIEEMDIP